MTQVSDNLTARRESLGLSVPDVHDALLARGIEVAFSTVAGWFNGSRGVRKMENLKALCAILQTDLNGLGGDEIEVAEGPVDATVVREMRALDPVQREAVLALIRAMKGAP
ncbi:MAG TPA: helix-turn-helix transcriptional regulator [Chloroflexota bacterium]|nr:helix-turn-helix transcriptional regulator [Chloroflexota bacterium]